MLLQGQVSGHRTARTNANQLFDRLDKNRKGKLHVSDLKAALTLSQKQIDELLLRLEADKSGARPPCAAGRRLCATVLAVSLPLLLSPSTLPA